MKQETRNFLNAVNRGETEYPANIIDQCDEWITEGWEANVGIDGPTAPMYAAALFNEATTQDLCVANGETVPSYPKDLRKLAFQILKLDGHSPKPDIEAMYLDYVNNFLTVQKFADYYGISGNMAHAIINEAITEREKRLKK